MFEGANYYIANNRNYESVADFGAKRVLGMGGSLTGYINNGNAYKKDSFEKSNNTTSSLNETKNNKIKKYIKPALALLATLGGVLAWKKGGKKLASNLLKKIAPEAQSQNTGIVAKLKNKISQAADNLSKDSNEAKLERVKKQYEKQEAKAQARQEKLKADLELKKKLEALKKQHKKNLQKIKKGK